MRMGCLIHQSNTIIYPSCVRSKSKEKIVAFCDKRLFVGAMKLANKLNKIDAPIAIEQYPISRFKPKKLCADTIATIWPTIAIHRKTYKCL